MKKIFFISALLLLFSCSTKPAEGIYGEKFDPSSAVALADALNSYNSGKDTVYAITGTVENVCKHKGCWISFKDAAGKEFYINNNETFVIPEGSKGHSAIASGKFLKDDKGEVSFETTGVIIK